jgi:hypothetical protein
MRQGSDERIAVTAAVASMLAALTLAPLVHGTTWLFVAAITVITVMVSGIVARQLLRWWPTVAAVQFLVLLLTLIVLFARSEILTGPGALQTLGDLVSAGMRITREQAPPVEATRGIVLLVAGGTGLVALLVDVLAASLRQPALAGLPLLAIYCVPAALLDHGLPWYYFLAAAAGFLLLLSADSGDRIRGWGRVLTSSGGSGPGGGRRKPRSSESGLASGGRQVAAAAAVLAVLVPAVIPGLNNQILGGNGDGIGNGKGKTITRINPILDLRKDLVSGDDTKLLSYKTTVKNPAPLRIVTSDVFDGQTWSPSSPSIPKSAKALNGLPDPPGLSSDVKAVDSTTQITVGPLKETYLPMPYPARKVYAKGDWLYDAETLNVIGNGITTEDLIYTVDHLDVEPTAEQLADAAPAPATLASRYTTLPNMPAVIKQTAEKIAQDGTAYQQAIRLQRWFRSDGGFVYSTDAPTTKTGDSSSQAIVEFLKQKRGYCVHFASTMAVMARSLGIPARVAVGFLPGEVRADGSRTITAHDAHAWPELYFSGVGWVRFEPTPRGGVTNPPAWTIPPAGALPEDAAPTDEASSDAAPTASAEATTQAPKAAPDETQAPVQKAAAKGNGLPWQPVVVVLVVLLALAAPRVTKASSSRRRWRRAEAAGTASALAEAAWDDLRLGLSDLGVRWAASWTPRAVQQRLLDDYRLEPEVAVALSRLVLELENARYAPPGGATADHQGSDRGPGQRRHDVATIVAAVAAMKSGGTKWRARLWPTSGLASLGQLGPWVNATASRAGAQASNLGDQVREKVGK